MLSFIFNAINAVIWTLAVIRTTYEESKRMYFVGAFLLWFAVVIDILEYIIL
jgi:hypothetical protein